MRAMPPAPRSLVGCVIGVACALAQPALAQIQTLPSPNPIPLGSFGEAIDSFGKLVIVGEPDNTSGNGAAHIFERQGDQLVFLQTLVGTGLTGNDRFGEAVAINERYAVVGAPLFGNGSDPGRVFVFERIDGVWVEQLFALPEPDVSSNSRRVGRSVDINEFDQIAAGTLDNQNANGVFLFERDEFGFWNQIERLLPSEPSDNFSESLAFVGDLVVVGDPAFDADGVNNIGAVFVFTPVEPGVWIEEAILVADQPTALLELGRDVAFEDATLAATALGEGVYVFRRDKPNQWVQEAVFGTPPFQTDPDFIARSLELDQQRVFTTTGALGDLPGQVEIAVASFERIAPGQWEQVDLRPIPSMAEPDNDFGADIEAIGPDLVLVGAPDEDVKNQSAAGIVYVYPATLVGGFPSGLLADCNGNNVIDAIDLFDLGISDDCNSNGIPDECDIASGFSTDLNGDGRPDECPITPELCPGDTNNDGVVDSMDLNAVLGGFGDVCVF